MTATYNAYSARGFTTSVGLGLEDEDEMGGGVVEPIRFTLPSGGVGGRAERPGTGVEDLIDAEETRGGLFGEINDPNGGWDDLVIGGFGSAG